MAGVLIRTGEDVQRHSKKDQQQQKQRVHTGTDARQMSRLCRGQRKSQMASPPDTFPQGTG